MSLPSAEAMMNALPLPVLTIGSDNEILRVNTAAEAFLESSQRVLERKNLRDYMPFGSPVLALVDEVRMRGASVSEYRVDVGGPRLGMERIVDAFAIPLGDDDGIVVLMLQERTIADKMNRQLTHRTAARSVTALGAMLAHEIKNPLSGIRGAAQLLEQSAGEDDRLLTRLICDEADRIVKLVERVELFGEAGPAADRAPINIHAVLDHVKRLAQSGFARNVRIVENYDPSLPPIYGSRDQLIQVFINLLKNAAEAIGPDALEGEIVLSTAFRTGMRLQSPGSSERVSLPIEIAVRDNGPGIPDEFVSEMFDPFVTTKENGTGLGLALVAKIIGDHGGIVECDPAPRRTTFRILLPMFSEKTTNGTAAGGHEPHQSQQ
jgi:two-component system nitrogen regulation sensor histidine kinase GlnL